ncbi:MAG TPA: methyltransferase domain-containing protein [Gaiellaceae bacterium]|nr:methyltransferase domain-containing protein [Gaiellaceae bacterium]
MSAEPWTDRRYLRDEQYRDQTNLRARIELHARFSTNPGWQQWVFDRLELADGERVLEVGCGPGDLWRANLDRLPDVALTLADLSPGMIDAAREAVGVRAEYAVADAQELPLPDGSFDLVVANHMLYHVPDRPRALAELRRVLRPGGRLVATTNGAEHLAELVRLSGAPGANGFRGFDRFGLENGPAQLEPFFADVEVERYEDALEVTEVEPVLAYLRSTMSLRPDEDDLPRISREVAAAIERDGSFHVTKSQGLVRGGVPLT